jgi:hypothetical protein
VVSLVVKKELEKRGPGRPKGRKDQVISQSRTGALRNAIEVDTLAPESVPAKRHIRATLSFGVEG